MMHTPRQYAMPRHRSSDSFTQVEHPTQIRPGRSRRLHLVNGDVSGIRVNTKTRDRPQKATGRSMTKVCNTCSQATMPHCLPTYNYHSCVETNPNKSDTTKPETSQLCIQLDILDDSYEPVTPTLSAVPDTEYSRTITDPKTTKPNRWQDCLETVVRTCGHVPLRFNATIIYLRAPSTTYVGCRLSIPQRKCMRLNLPFAV